MNDVQDNSTSLKSLAKSELAKSEPGQIVLVLQGGGALGSYQAGVYQALHEAGIEPDWVIGTSIGAINASLIAGNDAADRLSRLREFWSRVQQGPFHRQSRHCRCLAGWSQTGSRLLGAFQAFSSRIRLPSLVPTYR